MADSTSRDRARYKRSYFGLIGSSFISNGGNAFTNLAIPLYVLQTTGSAAQTGIVAVVNYAPPIVSSIFGGALVDRIGRRRTLLISEALNLVGTALIPIFHLLGILNFPLLLVLVALGAVLDSPARASRGSMIPTFATRAGFSPERAQVMNQSGFFLSQTVGPSLAGLIISLYGPTTAIWVDACSFVVSFLIVAALVDNPAVAARLRPSTYREDLLEGFHYVWRDPFIRSMSVMVTYLTMFYVPLFTVLYPVYFTERIHSARALGVFIGLESAGTFLGGIVYGVFAHRTSRWFVFIGSQFAGLPFLWLLLATPAIPILWIAAFLNGFLTGPLNSVVQVALQVRVSDDMRPRVNSLITASSLLAIPAGALLMGLLIETIGVLWTFGFVAAFYTIGPAIVAAMPVFHLIDEDLPEVMAV